MKSSLKLLFVFLTIIFTFYCSFAQDWQWAKHWGADGLFGVNERVNSLIKDGSNFYAIGSFSGSFYMPADTLFSSGVNENFIVKFNGNGDIIWAKSFGGNYSQPDNYEDANGIYDSVNKKIYLGGTYLSSGGKGSIFIAQMDTAGSFIWQKFISEGGYYNDALVFVEPDGDALLTGNVTDTAYFGTVKVNPGGFFARYDKDGNLKWAEQKYSDSITVSDISFMDSDMFISGFYNNVNQGYFDTVFFISKGSYDAFILRADSFGRIKWSKTWGNAGSDAANKVAMDGSKNLYLTGSYTDSVNIDGNPIININSGKDILLAKFNQNGNLIWYRQMNASNAIYIGGSYIKYDLVGNVYISGLFSGSAQFGNYYISTTNPYDMFLTRYDSSGNCYGVQHFGQASARDFVIDNSGNIICSGSFRNTVNIGTNTFTSYGGFDIFIAKSDAITGIQQQNRTTNSQLFIYANPNTGKCNITVPDEFSKEENLTLRIFDNSGKLIQEQTVEMYEDKVKVNLEAEAKGIYNVTLSNKKKSYAGKIVFE